MNNKQKKQFIAGAVCPECNDMDSLVLFVDDQRIECVSCDFIQTSEQRDAEQSPASKPKPSTTSNKQKPKFSNAGNISITQIKD
jgi:uncharacterized metal-binding protein (TIGR02443 family)